MKDMGEVDIILGINITRDNDGIWLTQSHYIEKVIGRLKYQDCSLLATPLVLSWLEIVRDTLHSLSMRRPQGSWYITWRAQGQILHLLFGNWIDILVIIIRFTGMQYVEFWNTWIELKDIAYFIQVIFCS